MLRTSMRRTELRMLKHPVVCSSSVFLAGIFIYMGLLIHQAAEPEYENRRLSEWLEAFNSNLWFVHATHPSGFTDAAIEKALVTIGERANPFLVRWLQERPSPVTANINTFLDRHVGTRLIRFRFRPVRNRFTRR